MTKYINKSHPEVTPDGSVSKGVNPDGTRISPRNSDGTNYPNGTHFREGTAGINAQLDLSLGYVVAIVNNLVKDAALAKSVNDAITAKFAEQKDGCAKEGTDRFSGNHTRDNLTA